MGVEVHREAIMGSGCADIRVVEEGAIGGRLPGKPQEIEERPLDSSPTLPPQLDVQEVPQGPVGITVSKLREET
jgi:hypothetical protein